VHCAARVVDVGAACGMTGVIGAAWGAAEVVGTTRGAA
jgi:predicted nicotinamide N-methyase